MKKRIFSSQILPLGLSILSFMVLSCAPMESVQTNSTDASSSKSSGTIQNGTVSSTSTASNNGDGYLGKLYVAKLGRHDKCSDGTKVVSAIRVLASGEMKLFKDHCQYLNPETSVNKADIQPLDSTTFKYRDATFGLEDSTHHSHRDDDDDDDDDWPCTIKLDEKGFPILSCALF